MLKELQNLKKLVEELGRLNEALDLSVPPVRMDHPREGTEKRKGRRKIRVTRL